MNRTGDGALKVSVVVGNPRPQSRTARIATALAESLLEPGTYRLSVIDLADYASKLFDWPSDEMATLNADVATSDLLIVASPTYKASYTGLLKTFLDRYPNLGLRGVVAIPLMTGADLRHSMGPEVHLRPLLVELGAIVPTQGFYFVMDQMDQLDAVVAGWVAEARGRLNAHLAVTLAAVTPTAPSTPEPSRQGHVVQGRTTNEASSPTERSESYVSFSPWLTTILTAW